MFSSYVWDVFPSPPPLAFMWIWGRTGRQMETSSPHLDPVFLNFFVLSVDRRGSPPWEATPNSTGRTVSPFILLVLPGGGQFCPLAVDIRVSREVLGFHNWARELLASGGLRPRGY